MAISINKLSALPAGTVVTLDALRKYRMIDSDIKRVKILGKGTVASALTVTVPCSKSAQASIEKAGGKIDIS